MTTRIEEELSLLRNFYSNVNYSAVNGIHWFYVDKLETPSGWLPEQIPVVFYVTEGYPGIQPYGFFVPKETNLGGNPPDNSSTKHQPPFEGEWRFLSWQPKGWTETSDISSGSNLWAWVRTFMQRLKEGT